MKIKEFTSNICVECTKKMGSCCERDPYVPLTIKDINRIKKLGLKIEDFVTAENYSKEDIIGPEKWWLNSFVLINKKPYKLILKKDKKNVCIFLNPKKGCTIGMNRPFSCKLYPFWLDPKTKKVVFDKSQNKDCYLGKLNLTENEKLLMIQENDKKARKYYNEMKEDCIKNKKKHERIVKSLLNVK